MIHYRQHIYLYNFLIAMLLVGGVTASIIANADEHTGATTNGCTCHGSQNSNTSITLSSSTGSFVVDKNEKATITVSVENSAMSGAGMNFGVKANSSGGNNIGTLAAGTGTQIQSGEVTHNGRQNMSGGKYDFTFDWTAPSEMGEYYILGSANAVNNDNRSTGDQWNKTSQKITVAGFEITEGKGGEEWCVGSSQLIKWKSFGVSNVKIELSSDGGSTWPVTIVNSTDAASGQYSWNIPPGFQTGSNFKIRLSDASKTSRNEVSPNFFSIIGGVDITSHPQSKEVCSEEDVTLTVEALGAGSYQWRKDGSDLPGKTGPSLALNKITKLEEGNYDCVIGGKCGDPVTSNVAAITVNISPGFSKQPDDVSSCIGGEAEFIAEIVGDDLTGQWQKDGVNIPGATSSTLKITNLKESDAGDYKLILISSACNKNISSRTAKLTIGKTPEITSQPEAQTVCAGEKLTLTVEATGSISGYKWYKDGNVLNGKTTKTLEINGINKEGEGLYKVEILSSCGDEVVSEEVMITVNDKPEIVAQPKSIEAIEGSDATFTLSAKNSGAPDSDLKYQWYVNSKLIEDGTEPTLMLSAVEKKDEGSYSCVITNSCDLETISEIVQLTVIQKGTGPAIAFSKSVIDFGNVNVAGFKSEQLIITNTGSEDLVISSYELNNENPPHFIPTINTDLPATISPEGTLSIDFTFNPKSEGQKTAEFTLNSNAINKPSLTLTGNGVATTEKKVVALQLSIDFDETEIGESTTKTLTLANQSDSDVNITSISIEPANNVFRVGKSTPILAMANSEEDIEISFHPINSEETEASMTIEVEGQEDIVVELKGEVSISSIRENIAYIDEVKVYPKPSKEKVSIDIIFNAAKDYKLNIRDINGGMVYNSQGIGNMGLNQIEWDGKDMNGKAVSSGKYYVLIEIDGNAKAIELVIEK